MGIFVGILKVFSDKLFFLNLARRLILLFANKKKDLVRIELTFLVTFTGSFNYYSSEYEAVL